jgi:TolB-like protein/DNA-binding SARP family transcriptional activator/Tfp pilus assembly protein PilF
MIELRTLGGVDLRSAAGDIALPLTAQPKRLALLVFLSLGELSGYRRRDLVVGLFWPELDTAHARGALRQALHALRRAMGQDTICTRGEQEVSVNREALWCDAVAFRDYAEAGRHEDALKLYSGDFLEGFFASDVAPEYDQWIAETRADLRRRAAVCAWALARAHRDDGDLASAAALARRASELALEDENGVARLIAFLDELGDRGGALEVYNELVIRLRAEYDAEPSPETQALIDRVRRRTLATARPPAVDTPSVEASRAEASDVGPPPGLRPVVRRRHRVRTVAIVLGVGAVVLALADRGSAGFRTRPYSIAVVPLQDLSGDTSRAYVAEGLTDQLITDLAQLGTLEVINRRTMMTYRGSRKSIRQIADDLHANAVLSGTIQSFGDTVRMTAQIVLARGDRAIWAQTFEGSRGDLLRMQREAARTAAQSIRGELTPSQRTSLPRVRAFDPEALDLYIKGRYYWNKRGPGLLKSVGLFSNALDLDPTFALAYSGMADAYVQLGYGNGLAPGDAFPKARAAALRALDLDSTLAEPHATLAFVHMYYDLNWTAAEREFERAITLNPSYATAHEWYGLFLTAMGRFDEARRQERRAQELDPLSTAVGGTAAWVEYYAGDFRQAEDQLHIVLREDSMFALGHLYLGRVYEATHRPDSAMAQYRATGPLRTWVPTVSGEGYLLATLSRNVEARATLARLDSMRRSTYVSALAIAVVHVPLQEPDSAFAWLDRAVAERTNWLVWLNRDPRWRPLRVDPRFARLTHKLGLPD